MQDKCYIICGNAPTDGIKENPDRDLRLRLWGKDGPDRDQDGETGAVERVWGDGEYEQEIEMSKMDLMQCDWCFRNVATEDQQPRGWIWVLDGVDARKRWRSGCAFDGTHNRLSSASGRLSGF